MCKCSVLSALSALVPRLSSGYTKLRLSSLLYCNFSAANFVVLSIRILLKSFCAVTILALPEILDKWSQVKKKEEHDFKKMRLMKRRK